MLHDLNLRLTEIKLRMHNKKSLEKRYGSANDLFEKEKARAYDLLAELQKEQADVTALEGLSLKAFFYSVFGDKAMQLHKEKKEFVAAKLKYDECNESVEELQKDLEELSNQLKQFEHVNDDYAAVLREKENAIRFAKSWDVEQLDHFTEEYAVVEASTKEYTEAITAGNDAYHAIEETLEKLQSAQNWGMGDMVMGGLIVTAIKHSKIDSARNSANRAQRLLKRFGRELKDIEYHPKEIKIEIGSFLTFADYFFDGLIVDWMAQSRINASYDKVRRIKRDLKLKLGELRSGLGLLESKKQDIEERKVQFIESV